MTRRSVTRRWLARAEVIREPGAHRLWEEVCPDCGEPFGPVQPALTEDSGTYTAKHQRGREGSDGPCRQKRSNQRPSSRCHQRGSLLAGLHCVGTFDLSARGRRALRHNFSNAKSNVGSSTVVSSDDCLIAAAIRVARGDCGGKGAVGEAASLEWSPQICPVIDKNYSAKLCRQCTSAS